MIKFTADLVCTENESGMPDCADKIQQIAEKQLGIKFFENGFAQGHISIWHKDNAHVIWVFIYDVDGVHESETTSRALIEGNSPTPDRDGKYLVGGVKYDILIEEEKEKDGSIIKTGKILAEEKHIAIVNAVDVKTSISKPTQGQINKFKNISQADVDAEIVIPEI